MIKILFFIESLEGGGAEKVLRNLVNNMDRSRFDITVKTLFPENAGKYLAPDISYGYLYPSRSGFYRLLMRTEAQLGTAYALRLKGDYDIECAYLECGATKIMSASTNAKAKKLAWVHCDLQKAMPDPKAFAEKTKRQYARFDKVLCVSESVRSSFVELFGDGFAAEVLYNTVDDAQIKSFAAEPLPSGEELPAMTVLSLGRLAEQKNYLRLLRVHKRLIDEGIRHNVWILGEGPERKSLERYIEENKLGDTVKLKGFKDNPYPYVRRADLLVCSSDYEGLSTFVTEGLVLGKPIVTTDCNGMRELLGDSEFGLITELSDDGLYRGMKKMLTDKTLRSRYEQKAAERGQDFSARRLAEKTEEYFEELIGS